MKLTDFDENAYTDYRYLYNDQNSPTLEIRNFKERIISLLIPNSSLFKQRLGSFLCTPRRYIILGRRLSIIYIYV